MEAEPLAALTSRGRPSANHAPMVPKQAVTTGYHCQAQQRAAPTSGHDHPQRMQTPAEIQTMVEGEGRRASSLPSHVPYTAAPTSRCKIASVRCLDADKLEHPPWIRSHDEVQI